MKFLSVTLVAALLCYGNGISVAKEWSTPEALRAFGKPGDTVRDPTHSDANKPSASKAIKNNKQTVAETNKVNDQKSDEDSITTKKPDIRLEGFKTELLNAYTNPDTERIRTLTYPKSLACMRAEPKYEQYLLRAETLQAIPTDAIISLETVDANAVLPYRGFNFPLRPSHIVRMEFGKKRLSDGSKTSQVADKYIARVNDRWYLLFPCPTTEGMGRLREMGLLD